jgi:sporulation protein YlmC with PRC-barrel domain
MQIEKIISPLIASQFPAFYKQEGPNFIAFVQAYYEWMEEKGQVTHEARSILEYGDIDSTTSNFIHYFKNKYIQSLPESIIADKTLLVKHIIDLYRSKGTEKAYKLLFRLLFNEDIDVYTPGEHLFKTSDATWYIPHYIEVSNYQNLEKLVGRQIYSGGAKAVVENYSKKIVNSKTINVLYLSNVEGVFKFNQEIFCLDYPEITHTNAPIVVGSLSAISINNGGANFNVGDLLTVNGTGAGAVAQVASTTQINGKVTFNLLNGGFGYSVNAIVTVSNGFGAGATFNVGGITNKQIYTINIDTIGNVQNTLLDIYTEGFVMNTTSSTGAFTNGELVTSSANVRHLDVKYINGAISNGESVSNSSLGISGLTVYNSDGNVIYITGTDSNLNNANLINNVILVSNTSASTVKVNSTYPKITISGNAAVNSASSNTTVLTVYKTSNTIGYFIPGMTVTGQSSGKTAVVTKTTRSTDWTYFPANPAASNLDTKINIAFNNTTKEVGTISYLKNINPGIGYSVNPTVTITEPYIYDLRISDGFGGFWGHDAVVSANAGIANGVVTAVTIKDSGFGYNIEEFVNLTSGNNITSVSGFAIVDQYGTGSGYWKDNSGFTSDTRYIQDSEFYQIYSYQIIASRMLETYKDFVKDLIHPTGVALYGKFSISSILTEESSLPVSFTLTQS